MSLRAFNGALSGSPCTCAIRPIRSAWSASIFIAVVNISSAWAFPNRRLSRWGSAPASNQSQGRSAVTEDRIWSGDSVTASERQVKSTTHAIALNRGNHRPWELFDHSHWPSWTNSSASDTDKRTISLRSAPAEKKFLFPAMISGVGRAICARVSTVSIKAETQARVRRLV